MEERTGSSTINYLLGDHSLVPRDRLGSTSITTDSLGMNPKEVRYYPWGTDRYYAYTSSSTYRFTGQRTEFGFGLYYYGARWYDPAAGRFVQPDTITPGGVQGLDRYAYVNNNPVRYADPSGHKCSDPHVADGDCSDYTTVDILREFYGISLVAGNFGEFSEDEINAIHSAAFAVGTKFSLAIGGGLTAGEAFKQVYDHITFLKGNRFADGGTGGLSSECMGITSGGCTSGAHLINFASMAGAGFSGTRGALRDRNNVVHELGHAFGWTSTGKDAYGDLSIAISNSPTLYGRGGVKGESYGFASPFGTFDWQMSYTNPEYTNEIFADQFLGWTFNTWYDGTWGNNSMLAMDQAEKRADWMNDHMAGYLSGE